MNVVPEPSGAKGKPSVRAGRKATDLEKEREPGYHQGSEFPSQDG